MVPHSSPFVFTAIFRHLSKIGLNADFHKIKSHLFGAYFQIETVFVRVTDGVKVTVGVEGLYPLKLKLIPTPLQELPVGDGVGGD